MLPVPAVPPSADAFPAAQPLPQGVRLMPLEMKQDSRGWLAEIYRANGSTGIEMVQWNVVKSGAGVLRGVHVHRQHTDYLVIVDGRVTVGLADLRDESGTRGRVSLLSMSGATLAVLLIPPGVAHGFYFFEPALYVNGVSHYFNPADDLGCHWLDPELGIPWPVREAILSDRDAALPSLAALKRSVAF